MGMPSYRLYPPSQTITRVVENEKLVNPLEGIGRSLEGHWDEAQQTRAAVDHKEASTIPKKFYHLLQGFIKRKDLEGAREVHRKIVRNGLGLNTYLGSQLIHMFSICGRLFEANEVFNKLPKPDLFAWSAIILAHAKLGRSEHALALYREMLKSSVKPSEYAFVATLKACSSIVALDHGKMIHIHIIESCCETSLYVGNALVDMYAKCDSLQSAHRVFDKMLNRDVVTWSVMIDGYAQQDCGNDAIELFQLMQEKGIEPNCVTFVGLLKACSNAEDLGQGRLIHVHIVESGFEFNVIVGNALLGMYLKCGNLKDAHMVFNILPKRNVVTWSTIIKGYAENKDVQEALSLFQHMEQEGLVPNEITYICILKACSIIAARDQGILIHIHILESGVESDMIVGSTLVNMYAKCGNMEDAHRIFDQLPKHDVVTWSIMIAGYNHEGRSQEALYLFHQMQQEGMEPNNVTIVSILQACAMLSITNKGKLMHIFIVENGFEWDNLLGNALIDMYAKCGCLEEARNVFNGLSKRDVVAWSAMIEGYAQCIDYDVALKNFKEMQSKGLKLDDGACINILSSCSHVGLVNEGCQYFKTMREEQGIKPTLNLYNCIVDLLGRAGHLNKAVDVLQTIPFQQNVVGWTSLLSHCRAHFNVEVAKECFNFLLAKMNASGYVLMANVYANVGMEEDANKILQMKNFMQALKKPGKAFIEVNNELHDFIVGDKSHSQIDAICKLLQRIHLQISKGGHVPHTDRVLWPMESKEKDDVTWS